MTNTKFRKRALLSAVAMMLVAILALGSATFAWFTANNTVSANDFSVTASSAEGLWIAAYNGDATEISAGTAITGANITAAEDWSSSVDLDTITTKYSPISPLFNASGAPTWYEGSADEENRNDYSLKTYASAGGSTYYSKQIWLKSEKASIAAINVQLKWTGAGRSYAKAAIVSVDETAPTVYYFAYDNETWHPLKADTTTPTHFVEDDTVTITPTADQTDCSIAFTQNKIAVGEKYMLYVWFEGQDEDCIDANAGQAVSDLDITFTQS